MSAPVQMNTSASAEKTALDTGSHTPATQDFVHDPEKLEPALASDSKANTTDEEIGPVADDQAAEPHAEIKQKWNYPRQNTYRFLTTIFSFIVMGMNDGAVGVSGPRVSVPGW